HGFYVGSLAQIFFDYGGEYTRRWLRIFSYTRSVMLSALSVAVGTALAAPLVLQYLREGLRLSGEFLPTNFLAVTGLLFVIVGGFINFTFTLSLHAAAANFKRK